MELSDEQLKIVKSLKNNNVIVNAVAGSGKTTTAFGVIEENAGKKILMLTFNKALQSETELKVRKKGYKNVKVATFHAFAGHLYGRLCKDNNGLRNLLFNNDSPVTRRIDYDILIIDEAQDLTLLFLCLIRKILLVNENKNVRVLVMGDFRQSIYQFMDADSRYLTDFEKFMGDIVRGKWVHLPLKQSYRVGKKTVDFINKAFYKNDIMIANNSNDIFEYLVVNTWEINDQKEGWFNYVLSEIKKYDVNDVFVLSQSNNNPITTSFSNLLNENGLIVENSGDIFADKKQKKNKINFSTFHSSKGLEKKLAIVLGFDSSLDFFALNEDEINDPLKHNPEYVAITRATEKVIAIASHDKHPLYFLDQSWIDENANLNFLNDKEKFIYLMKSTVAKPKFNLDLDSLYSVTSLCEFLKEKYVVKVQECFKVLNEEKSEPDELIAELKKIPTTVKELDSNGKPYEEDVANFNGIGIIQDFADHKNGKNPYVESLLNIMNMIEDISTNKSTSEINNPMLYNYVKATFFTHGKQTRRRKNATWLLQNKPWVKSLKINELKSNMNSLLKLVVLNETSLTNRTFIAKQITNYDWLPNDGFKSSTAFLMSYFKKHSLTFEDSFTYSFDYKREDASDPIPVLIQGYTDCIDWDGNSVYEFKFMGGIGDEERIQLVSYAMIIYSMSIVDKDFPISTEKVERMKWYLWNIKTGLREEIKIDFSKRDEFFKALIDNKLDRHNETDLNCLIEATKKKFGEIK